MAPVVYLGTGNRELAWEVRTHLMHLKIRVETGGAEDVARAASACGAEVVITDSMENAWEVLSQMPNCRTVLLATTPDPVHVRAALRAGVHEVLMVPDELSQLYSRVQALLPQAGTTRTFDSIVAAVYSGSGGMGRTTMATALARAYARQGLQTLLIDASLALGGVDHLLGITPPTTLANLIPVMAELDAEQLSTATVKVHPNLDVLCSPADSFIIVKLTPEHLDHLLNVARKAYQVVVVDMPSEPGLLEMVFLRQADQIAYLMTSSPEAIRVLSHVLVALEMEGVGRSKIGLVHRLRLPAALELAGSDLARQVGLHYLGSLPHDWSRTFRAKAPAAKNKETITGLDQAAHRLALRLAALSGVPVRVQQKEGHDQSQRPGLQPLAWLKGGLSRGGQR